MDQHLFNMNLKPEGMIWTDGEWMKNGGMDGRKEWKEGMEGMEGI